MSKTIIIKNSQIADSKPSLDDLVTGELAVNTADAVLYIKKDDGFNTPEIVQIGTSAPELIDLPNTSSTITWNVKTAPTAQILMNGNKIIADPVNKVSGARYQLVFKQDSTGGRTAQLHSNFKLPLGVTFALSTSPNAIDILDILCVGPLFICQFFKGYGAISLTGDFSSSDFALGDFAIGNGGGGGIVIPPTPGDFSYLDFSADFAIGSSGSSGGGNNNNSGSSMIDFSSDDYSSADFA